MHRHARVAQHGFGAGGRYGDVAAGLVFQRIADVVELAVDIVVVHLKVRQGGGAADTAVDDALVPVDQALLVEADEGGADGVAGTLVEGEPVALPVGGDAQAAGLLVDDATGLFDVLPDPLHEGLAADVMAAGALVEQLPLHDPLGGDPGVVCAGQPEGGDTGHATIADERVLEGFLQCVPQVKLTGHIGRRHDDDVGIPASLGNGVEVVLVQPVLVDAPFHVSGVVGPGHSA